MKRRLLFVMLFLILVLPVVSCARASAETHVSISCDDFTQHPKSIRNEFTIGIGDKVYVDLCSNPTTGFKWSYNMTGDSSVKQDTYSYNAPDTGLVGASGAESWTFEGTQKGVATISFQYSQPWDGGTKDVREYLLTITVK